MDHRNTDDCEKVREWLKQEFNGELVVINGKYKTDVGKAGSHEQLIAEISDLAASEHKH